MKLSKAGIWVFKLLVAALPLYILVSGDRFDLSSQISALQQPLEILLLFVIWALCVSVLVAWRWRSLAKVLSLELSFSTALSLQFSGVFLSTWLPGGIGGDLWKAYQFGQHVEAGKHKHYAYISVLLDRFIGLYAMVCCGALAAVFRIDSWQTSFFLYPIYLLIGVWLVASGLLFASIFLAGSLPQCLQVCLHRLKQSWSLANSFAEAIACIRLNKRNLALNLGLSVVIQILHVLLIYLMTMMVTGISADFLVLMSIFTLSVLSIIISLAPGGIGVGHYLFDVLYTDRGYLNGADVFNYYLFLTAVFSLIGLLPFLLGKYNKQSQIRSTTKN